MPHPFSIRLGDALDARLERIARLTGRSKSFYVKQALLSSRSRTSRTCSSPARLRERVADGRESLIPLAELERELGVAD